MKRETKVLIWACIIGGGGACLLTWALGLLFGLPGTAIGIILAFPLGKGAHMLADSFSYKKPHLRLRDERIRFGTWDPDPLSTARRVYPIGKTRIGSKPSHGPNLFEPPAGEDPPAGGAA